jgi:hypothetical protein
VILAHYGCVLGRGDAVGNSFVDVGIVATGSGDAAVVEFGGLLVGASAATCGAGWAVVSWFVDGALVISPRWLHPYSESPASAPAMAIRIFRNDFINRHSFL